MKIALERQVLAAQANQCARRWRRRAGGWPMHQTYGLVHYRRG